MYGNVVHINFNNITRQLKSPTKTRGLDSQTRLLLRRYAVKL